MEEAVEVIIVVEVASGVEADIGVETEQQVPRLEMGVGRVLRQRQLRAPVIIRDEIT